MEPLMRAHPCQRAGEERVLLAPQAQDREGMLSLTERLEREVRGLRQALVAPPGRPSAEWEPEGGEGERQVDLDPATGKGPSGARCLYARQRQPRPGSRGGGGLAADVEAVLDRLDAECERLASVLGVEAH